MAWLSSLDDVTLEWNKSKEEDEGPGFESVEDEACFSVEHEYFPVGLAVVPNRTAFGQFDRRQAV
jgi:hypothetical protein